MIRKLSLLASITLAISLAAYDDAKPSPIGRKRSHVVDRQPVATPKDTKLLPASPNVPVGAGSDTGVACFFRPKVTLDADGLPVEPAPTGLTAAHASYPLGSRVKVTNLGNKKSVVVKITERSIPSERIISLSFAAAQELNFVRFGTAQVHLEKID